MSVSRQLLNMRPSLRPFLRASPRTTLQASQARYATSDYGSGKGDPKGERPEKQGKNPSENLEHPGRPAPDVGQKNTDTHPNNQNKSQSSSASSSSSSSSKSGGSDEVKSSGQSEKANQSVKGKQPKILSDNPPAEDDPSVKKHNEEMDRRAERAAVGVSNKDAGKDKQPGGSGSHVQ